MGRGAEVHAAAERLSAVAATPSASYPRTQTTASASTAARHTFLLDVWNKHGPDAATGFLDMLLTSFEMPE